jgi:hypothetical protein
MKLPLQSEACRAGTFARRAGRSPGACLACKTNEFRAFSEEAFGLRLIKKMRPFVFLLALAELTGILSGHEPDFRRVNWGMTQAQVLATEADRPAEIRESGGEVVVRYESSGDVDLPGRLVYIFVDDKLVRAKYLSTAQHDEPNDYIADFRAVEPQLMKRYGKPASERAVWDSDLFQQERLPYLDQDRALATDILPSDTNAGISVSMGYLRLYTQRIAPGTKIVHALTGAEQRITHQIEYRSIEFEELENKLILYSRTGGR